MSHNIPDISIAKVMNFNAAGMPDNVQFEIAAIIDTADEITHLGRIRFEDASDIVLLYNILGSYIRMNDLDEADTEEEGEEEGGEQ